MNYPFLEYLQFKLDYFRYWLGFRTSEEHWQEGFFYGIKELLAGRDPIIRSFDIDEFDKGVEAAKKHYWRNR